MSRAPSWLPAQGYFGLMFLKHYAKLSDEKLLERFNTDWAMQFFCGVQLADNEMIRDNAFVSNVRTYLGKNIDFEAFQKSMINHWNLEIPASNLDKKPHKYKATCHFTKIWFWPVKSRPPLIN